MKRHLVILCSLLFSLLLSAEERDGYRIERVSLQSGHAYLLCPNSDGPHPAVLVLHDHGAWFSIGKEKMTTPLPDSALSEAENARISEDATQWRNKCYSGIAVADSLAKAGFVVLVTDALYWGERSIGNAQEGSLKEYNSTLKQYQKTFYDEHLEATGEPWFETILREDQEAITYLSKLPFVDANRICCFGFSMGAYRSWQLAAADSRIYACAAANWMTSACGTEYITSPSSYSMYRPALYLPHKNANGALTAPLDYPDIAATIAPRPFLLQYGKKDHLFQREKAGLAFHKIEEAFAAYPGALTLRGYDADHLFTEQHLHDLIVWLLETTAIK